MRTNDETQTTPSYDELEQALIVADTTIAALRQQLTIVTQDRDAHKEMIRKISEGQNPVHVLTQGISMVIELQHQLATVTQERDELKGRYDNQRKSIVVYQQQLATARQDVWEEAAKYWDAPDWHSLAERYPADEYPKWSDSFAAWCRQQAEGVKP